MISMNLPGFVIFPAFIVSPMSMNKQNEDNNVNEENVKHMFVINATKLSLNDSSQEYDPDIEPNFRQALDRGNNADKVIKQIKLNETFSNKAELKNKVIAGKDEVTTEDATLVLNVTENMTTELYTTTEISGFYSDSRYNNTDVNSLAITVKNPDSKLHPPLTEEERQNFTVNTSESMTELYKTEADSMNITDYPSENTTGSQIQGVYEDALYNNAEIDQLSITTNFYTNELALPPPQDDRWSNFSSVKETPPLTEFKPLAGLYYDRFLHKPVTKSPGFVPYNHYYYYY